MSHYLVLGAKGGQTLGAAAPNRLEINDLIKDPAQFSLYIQALQSIFSDKSQNDIDSFFQIGGIHGLPYIPWDGSGQRPVDRTGWEGYCTHGDVLFPTFHRPYVLLMEQAIQQAAIKIASTYTVDAQRFQTAAQNLRQPYWDWARNAVPPAEVISLDKVNIITKDGSTVSVPNPLRRYTFHPIEPTFPNPYRRWGTTYRYPTSTGANPQEDLDLMRQTLASSQSQITQSTFGLLTRVHTWPAFSNHTPGDGGSSSSSLEAIHDGIHVDVGGSNGHMTDPAVAAFDPIFFMHHCNVDRLLSLWSALNPGVWVTPNKSQAGTWTTVRGTTVDKNSNLTPFWNTQTTYWNSANVVDTATLGYTYPEFNNLNPADTAGTQRAIANIVTQLYGGSSSSGRSIARSLAAVAPKGAPSNQGNSGQGAEKAQSPFNNLLATSALGSHSDSNGSGEAHSAVAQAPAESEHPKDMWEWSARVQVKKYELGSSFSVPIFLGEVPEEPRQWLTCPSFVGAHHAFVNSSVDQCANCRNQHDIVLEGFIHLNEAIMKHSDLQSLEPSVVEPYLKRELNWRVVKVNCEAVELSQMESLEIVVFANRLSLPPGSVFPVVEENRRCDEITAGRPCGSRGRHGSA